MTTFMTPFQKLKDWSDDDPDSLAELNLRARMSRLKIYALIHFRPPELSSRRNAARELLMTPVESKFVSTWREFEKRFGDALLIVRSKAVFRRTL